MLASLPFVPSPPSPPKTLTLTTRRSLISWATALVSSSSSSSSSLLPSSAASPPLPPRAAGFFEIPASGGVKALDLRVGAGETPVDGDQVISGIQAAVKSMKVGGIRRVIIPPSQGYQNPSQEPVPPNVCLLHFRSQIPSTGYDTFSGSHGRTSTIKLCYILEKHLQSK
ncbi:peptidyl-prolyl cis-trans isomerase FKBP17-1, chloroplastic-like isoform X4 [Phoenix dactylifera]|uniref:peptidylprolyl isomerase n=1 Tax=Phoenix dactylifera TaxID=42345 RepID=A0A8B9AYI6_PHODC|nr:peptidyl-prolyl cis-trans isomerase FKBP17-1, chloroplastic-like isoform X4 [Phoenix dactylifera]